MEKLTIERGGEPILHFLNEDVTGVLIAHYGAIEGKGSRKISIKEAKQIRDYLNKVIALNDTDISA